MQIRVSYINPLTNRRDKRTYKLAPGETETDGILFMFRALHFVFGQPVKFTRDKDE